MTEYLNLLKIGGRDLILNWENRSILGVLSIRGIFQKSFSKIFF